MDATAASRGRVFYTGLILRISLFALAYLVWLIWLGVFDWLMKKPYIKFSIKFVMGIIVVALIGGCAPHSIPPVINKSPARHIPDAYVVKRGDSIYNISWGFGLNFQDIAKWNGLKKPYAVKFGQVIVLRKEATGKTAKTRPLNARASATKQAAVATTLPAKRLAPSPKRNTANAPAVVFSKSPAKWNWPAEGKLAGKYAPVKGSNGIQIAGVAGSPIKATAAGNVVYAGEGLRGYGKLIIVKHSIRFLSAYAHNQDILVKEGQSIKSGQQIARMGSSGTQVTMLHFEIREDGKSVDPLKYLK